MRTYTIDELAELLGVDKKSFAEVVELLPDRRHMPHTYKLKTPLDVGERKKVVYLAEMSARGWAFFPSLASLRLWWQNQHLWVPATL